MTVLSHIRWWIEFLSYLVLEFTVARIPLPKVYRFGLKAGGLAYHLLPGRRATVRRNLRIAYGHELSLREIDHLVRRVFEKTGANLGSAIRTARMPKAELNACLRTRRPELMERALEKGSGVVLLIPHMGNWELLAQLPFLLPEDVAGGAHFRPLNNPYMAGLMARRRSRQGTRLFSKRGSPHAMAAFLRGGGVLGVLADQRVGRPGHFCPFFGRFTSCTPLPEALAARTGAALLAISLRALQPGRWEATLHPVREPDSPSAARAVEKAMRLSPSDAFWFSDRFRLPPRDPLGIPAKPHPKADPSKSRKPVRLLIWLPNGDPRGWLLPDGARPELALELAVPVGAPVPRPSGFHPARLWRFDPSLPPEQLAPTLREIDEGDPLPLDGVLARPGVAAMQTACRRARVPFFPFPASAA